MTEERNVRGEVFVEPGYFMFFMWVIAIFLAIGIGSELDSIAKSLEAIATSLEAKP